MNYSYISILDLLDEILLIIFAKLKSGDAFYSLFDINERLDKIVCDTIYTQSIDLVTTSSNSETDSLSDLKLNRFCLEILPRIHHNIKCLTLKPSSIECIFRTSDYPNLHKLNLSKFELKDALYYFNDNLPFAHIFKKQISHLVVTVTDDAQTTSLENLATDVYGRIFTFFTSVTHLEFDVYHTPRHPSLLLQDLPLNICFSSNIVHLCVKVLYFDDCLRLLDGCLYQMNTFIVTFDWFSCIPSHTIRLRGLHNLKCFSLMSRVTTTTYDDQIVPLLRQMSQLEKLTLSLQVGNRRTYVEGTHLNNEILSQIFYLRTFIFDIVTYIVDSNKVSQSSDDIQRTFVQDVGCYIDYFPHKQGRCHIYPLLFTMKYMHAVTNNFPGGIFRSVRTLSIFDDIRPFEHDFFKRISHSFPLLNQLTVFNSIQQNEKRIQELYDNKKRFLIVEFTHLSKLNLLYAHFNYIEQFLLNTNTYLPSLDELEIQYEHLLTVTENFTSDATRFVCAKLKCLNILKTIVHSKDFYLCFPLL